MIHRGRRTRRSKEQLYCWQKNRFATLLLAISRLPFCLRGDFRGKGTTIRRAQQNLEPNEEEPRHIVLFLMVGILVMNFQTTQCAKIFLKSHNVHQLSKKKLSRGSNPGPLEPRLKIFPMGIFFNF